MIRTWFRRKVDPDAARTLEEQRLTTDVERAFSPPPDLIARQRDTLVAAFRSAALQSRPTPRQRLPAASRRFAASLLAVALVAVNVGVMLAQNGPGRPFYGVRIAIERLLLPPRGTQARIDGEMADLTERLAEVSSTAGVGDGHGLAAALEAYTADLRALRSDLGSAPLADTHVDRVLAQHAASLLSISGGGSEAVATAIGTALQENTEIRAQIGSAATPSPSPASGGSSDHNGSAATPSPTPANGGSSDQNVISSSPQ